MNDENPKNADHPTDRRRTPDNDVGNKRTTLNNKKNMCPVRQYYEKHRPPAGVPRAGVNGGSAPDAARVIRIMISVDFECSVMIINITHQQGWWVGMRP